jgi:hypothetical protein
MSRVSWNLFNSLMFLLMTSEASLSVWGGSGGARGKTDDEGAVAEEEEEEEEGEVVVVMVVVTVSGSDSGWEEDPSVARAASGLASCAARALSRKSLSRRLRSAMRSV